jgi:hypothetical protein
MIVVGIFCCVVGNGMAVGYNEYKYLVTNENLAYVRTLLEALYGHSDPYPEGVVDSVYYDDFSETSYRCCIEGEALKRKVRIRGYGDGLFHQFHIKNKDIYSVSKVKSPINPVKLGLSGLPTLNALAGQNRGNAKLQNAVDGLLSHGDMYPMVRVRYHRCRYRIHDFRVTLDTNIEIMAVGSGMPFTLNYGVLPSHVLEVKTLEDRPFLPLMGLVKLPQISFSKFYLGINMLKSGLIA